MFINTADYASDFDRNYRGPFDLILSRNDVGACRSNKEPLILTKVAFGRKVSRVLKLDKRGLNLLNPFPSDLEELPDQILAHYLITVVGRYFVLIDDEGSTFASDEPYQGDIAFELDNCPESDREEPFFEGYVRTDLGKILLTITEIFQPYFKAELMLVIDDIIADNIPKSMDSGSSALPLSWKSRDKQISITVYRSAEEIGGNCLLVKSDYTSIILDIGTPLSGVEPEALDHALLNADACLISHAHMDHYGEIEKLHADTRIYSGRITKSLIDATRLFTAKPALTNAWTIFEDGVPFTIGDFTITPYLVDHSAFDSYAFLICCGFKKILYTGDFRSHGRLSKALAPLDERLPEDLDLLICEGTMMSRVTEGSMVHEEAMTEDLYELLKDSDKPAFIQMSAQNIDRVLSVYLAAQKLNRIFIIDLYTAYILDLFDSPEVPKASWPGIRVFYPLRLATRIADYIDKKILYRYKKSHIKKEELNPILHNTIFLVRDSMVSDLVIRLKNIEGATFIHSMWSGYWGKANHSYNAYSQSLKDLVESRKMKFVQLHVGGHAPKGEINSLIEKLNPKRILPIHTENPSGFDGKIISVKNGEEFRI